MALNAARRAVAMLCASLLCAVTLSACGGSGLSGSGSGGSDPSGERAEATVVRVTDGDTVVVEPPVGGEDSVRMIGVDAPETAGSPRGAQPYGEEAAEFAKARLEGRPVELEFDREREDDYGRVLAYVHAEGTMFNEVLLREGYAQVATFPPNTRHLGRFEEAQREARAAERGIWGLPEWESCLLTDRDNSVGGGCP